MEGSFTLKKRITERMLYAQVDLEVEKISGRWVEIDASRFPRWKAAAIFAAEYFFDHYSGSEKGGLKITIQYLHDMEPYDTNNIIVFFVVVQALHQALEIPCDLTIDNSGRFVIP